MCYIYDRLITIVWKGEFKLRKKRKMIVLVSPIQNWIFSNIARQFMSVIRDRTGDCRICPAGLITCTCTRTWRAIHVASQHAACARRYMLHTFTHYHEWQCAVSYIRHGYRNEPPRNKAFWFLGIVSCYETQPRHRPFIFVLVVAKLSLTRYGLYWRLNHIQGYYSNFYRKEIIFILL